MGAGRDLGSYLSPDVCASGAGLILSLCINESKLAPADANRAELTRRRRRLRHLFQKIRELKQSEQVSLTTVSGPVSQTASGLTATRQGTVRDVKLFDRLTVRAKMMAVAGAFICGFIAFGAVACTTMRSVEVGSELFERYTVSVVANEVKELAKETARATEDISRKIAAIQDDAGSAVAAIDEISLVIKRINETQSTIVSSVSEQTAATGEIARNMMETSRGSDSIVGHINGVTHAAREAQESAAIASQFAAELSRVSRDMSGLMERFTLTADGQVLVACHRSHQIADGFLTSIDSRMT